MIIAWLACTRGINFTHVRGYTGAGGEETVENLRNGGVLRNGGEEVSSQDRKIKLAVGAEDKEMEREEETTSTTRGS